MSDSFFIDFSFFSTNYIVEVTERFGQFHYSISTEQYGRISKPIESKRILIKGYRGQEFRLELELNLEEYGKYEKVKAYYINYERDKEKIYIDHVKYSDHNPLGYNYKHQFLIKDYLLRLLKSAKIGANEFDLNTSVVKEFRDNEIIKKRDQLYNAEHLYFETFLPAAKVDKPRDYDSSHISPDIYCEVDLDDLDFDLNNWDPNSENEEDELSATFIERISSANTYLKLVKLSAVLDFDFEVPTSDFYKLQGMVVSHSLMRYELGFIRSSFWIDEEDNKAVFYFNKKELDALIKIIKNEEIGVTDFSTCQPMQWCIERMEMNIFNGDLNDEMSEEIEGWLEEKSFDRYGFDYAHRRMGVHHEKDDHRKMFVFTDTFVSVDYGYNGNINYIQKMPRKGFFDVDLPIFRDAQSVKFFRKR